MGPYLEPEEKLLPKRRKTKRADLEGGRLVIRSLNRPPPPVEVISTLLQVLTKETKILARVHERPTESQISVRLITGIAHNHDKWIRDPRAFKSRSHNPYQQCRDLISHLFEKYPTPQFLQKTLEEGGTFETQRSRGRKGVYLHIANGGNIRTAPEFPFKLTKTQAHLFHTTPGDPDLYEAVILAQAQSAKVAPAIARRLAQNPHVKDPRTNRFWNKFFDFLSHQEMVDPDQIGNLCDYLEAHRITRDRNNTPNGEMDFKGRTLRALLERMEAWHRELHRARASRNRTWEPTPGIKPKVIEGAWKIEEILREKDLLQEGREMNHCVYSYTGTCFAKKTSIWSLKEWQPESEEWKRAVTVEIRLGTQPTMTQTQAKNRKVSPKENHFLRSWAIENRVLVKP